MVHGLEAQVCYTLPWKINTSHGFPTHFSELRGKGEAFPGAVLAWPLAAPWVTLHPCAIPNPPWLGTSEQLLLPDPGLDHRGPAEGMWPSQPASTPGH